MGSTGLDKSTNPENPDRFEAEVSSQVGGEDDRHI
jgi:hypothetical protein